MIPAGKQRALAVRWAFGQAKTGTDQIGVVFDLLDLPGQQITWYGSFTDRATERTIESLRHCGWTCDRLDVLTGMGSQEVQLVVDHEEDQRGGQRARVKWVNKGGIALANEHTRDSLRSLADRIQRSLGGAPSMTQPPPPNDDIPF